MSNTFLKGNVSVENIKKLVEQLDISSENSLKINDTFEWNKILFKQPSTILNLNAWKIDLVLFLTQKKSLDELPDLDLKSNVFKFNIKYKIESDLEQIISIPFHYTLENLIEELEFQSSYSFKLSPSSSSSNNFKKNELLWTIPKDKIIKLNKTNY